MSALPAFAANLWLVGFPLVAIAGAALALLRPAPARLRYLAALAGFAATVALPLAWTRESAPRVVDVPAPLAFAAIPVGATGEEAGRTVDPPAALAWLWAAGAAALLGRELGAHLRLARRRRGWRAAATPLRRELEVTPGRELLLAEVPSPRTHGMLTPAIVLPVALPARCEPDVLRLIVAHEESHARWRDPLVHAALRALRCVLWVAPPVWIAERLVAREREAAADAAALRRASPDACTRYASALVRFARLAAPRGDLLAVRLGAASDLEYRVRRILRLGRLPVAGAALAGAVLACASLALAATPLAERPGSVLVVPSNRRAAQPPRPAAFQPTRSAGANRAAPAPGRAAAARPIDREAEASQAPAPRPAPAAPDRGDSASAREANVGVDLHRDVAIHVDRHAHVVDGEPDDEPVPLPLPSPAALEAPPSPPRRESAVVEPADLDGRGDDGDPAVEVHRLRQVNRIVVRGTSEGNGSREGYGRSRHPVALFHRAVTSPLKRLVRAARASPDAPP